MQILISILVLSILILVHEWGHFTMAKWMGMKVEEFGIGYPPRMIKLFRRKGTDFTLNWLPFGGFVRIYGEEYDKGEKGQGMFWQKPWWQRALVMVSGVVMNFLLGVVLFAIVYSVVGIPEAMDKVRLGGVAAESPAEMANLEEGDVLVWGEGEAGERVEFSKSDEVVALVDEYLGEEMSFGVKKESGEVVEVRMVPRENPPEGEGSLGVILSMVEMVKYPWWQMPFKGMVVGTQEALAWGKMIVVSLGEMMRGIFAGEGIPEGVAGPIGVYEISSQAVEMGWLAVLQFMAVFSMNLAVLNILPIPALDGGRIAFLALEGVLGKKKKNQIEAVVNGVSMLLLIGLMILVSVRDVGRIAGF